MNEKDEKRKEYLWFPVSLLRGFLNDVPHRCESIIKYHFTNLASFYAMNVRDLKFVSESLIYNFYNYKDGIPNQVIKYLAKKNFQYFGKDYDFRGFIGKEFDPIEEREELIAELERDPVLMEYAIKNYAIGMAFRHNLKRNGAMCMYYELLDNFKELPPPVTSCKFRIIKNLISDCNDEKYLLCFICFLALRSILGKKSYTATNWQLIRARALGFNTPNELDKALKNHQLDAKSIEAYNKLGRRRQQENIIIDLKLHYYMKYASVQGIRGFMVSFDKKVTLESLKELCELKTNKGKLKAIAEREKGTRFVASGID